MIRVRILGGLSATRDDQPASGAATQPRRLALLALIARAGDRGITRERILALLWPDAADETGRRALSQALHALRNDLHDDLFLGVQELRLNLAAATCDLLDFETAFSAREWERAAAAYAGPFLQGFRLGGAAEFDRWMEEERTHLAHRYAELLERLGRGAQDSGDAASAVAWWRRRAAMDPLNARVTVELMRALDANGERHAALHQARIYEAVVEQELSLRPDAEVVRFAEELRRTPEPVRATPPARQAAVASADPPAPEPPAGPDSVPDAAPLLPASAWGRPIVRIAAGIALVALAGTLLTLRGRRPPDLVPLLAVGAITDYRGPEAAAPLTDMLATNLARIAGLQVVSTARLLELIARDGHAPDAAGYASAARRTGASDLMEGELHAVTGGVLLELRRVNLADGRVRGAWRIEGTDLFALVDTATIAVATSLGHGPVPVAAQVGTRSLVAWRLYEEGLRHFTQGAWRRAQNLFEAATREDSAFAMAAWYQLRARHSLGGVPDAADLARLERLAAGAGDRDRLQLLAWVAYAAQSPALDALADTLIIRYPADIESQYLAAFARMARADFAAALPYLDTVLAGDSSGTGRGGRCLGCDARQMLVYAWHALDSMPRALQLARDWTRADPESKQAWALLGSVLEVLGRPDEALAARRQAAPFDVYDDYFPAAVWIRAGDFPTADRVGQALLADGRTEDGVWQGHTIAMISLRYQARWRDLKALAARRRAIDTPAASALEPGRLMRVWDAFVLVESGRARDAIPALDSLVRDFDPRAPLGVRVRALTREYTLLAEAAFDAGDHALVGRAADSAEAWAGRGGWTRDLATARHARALHRLARGDTTGALADFERAIWSPTLGFTRTNFRLGQLRLAQGDAAGAVAILRPALRGSLQTANFYVTHTELHELLAAAFERMGRRDSARVHWRWVADALARADPEARPRHTAVLARLSGP